MHAVFDDAGELVGSVLPDRDGFLAVGLSGEGRGAFESAFEAVHAVYEIRRGSNREPSRPSEPEIQRPEIPHAALRIGPSPAVLRLAMSRR